MTRIEHHSAEEREAIRARQEGELKGDTSEYIVHTRAVDHSLWLQISFIIEKYKVLIYLGGSFLVAMGFGWKTPKQNYDELRAEIAVVRAQVLRDSVQKAETNQMLRVLITFKCIESQATPRDMQIAGIDCTRYTNAH